MNRLALLNRLHAVWSRGLAAKAPTINFQTTPPTLPWLGALLWLLAAMLCATVWDNWMLLQDKEAQTVGVEEQFATLALQQKKRLQASIHTSPEQKKQLEAFAQQLLTPYALFTTLDRAWSLDVAILNMQVSTVPQEVDMEIESKGLPDAFRFIQRLKTDKTLDVYLQQSSINTQDPMQPTRVKLKLSGR